MRITPTTCGIRRLSVMAAAVLALAACSGTSNDGAADTSSSTESSTSVVADTTTPSPAADVDDAASTETTAAPTRPGNGLGWTLSQRDSAGGTTTELSGERCGSDLPEGTWTFTSVTTDPFIGRLVGNFTIEADGTGGGSFTLVMEIDSPMAGSDEARASGYVYWDLREGGGLEFNLYAEGPTLTYTNGVQDPSPTLDVSSSFDPIFWETGNC